MTEAAILRPEKRSKTHHSSGPPPLRLVWNNPVPATIVTSHPELVLECRSRRHADHILRLLDSGFVRERRSGEQVVYAVYQGTEPTPLRLVKTGSQRRAA
ncbi:MAG: hypothetical protein JJ896_10330 [Rhodothermales bacterium]|nr:hypothetical protein [Rhodothermales bacterium]MBO6780037.1 hypothetical protein [Rhodothermales bacterium]